MESEKNLAAKVEAVSRAIEQRLVIAFRYTDDERRIVEPVVLGIHKDTSKYILFCYRNLPLEEEDNLENWKQYEVEKIRDLYVTPLRAKAARGGYSMIHTDIAEIITADTSYSLSA